MEQNEAEDMARALVRQFANATYIHSLVKERFGHSPSIKRISAWRRHYITSDPSYKRTSHNSKPVPDDFADMAPTMNKAQLQRHYGVHWSGTIDRWLKEAGVTARRYISRTGRINYMGRPKPPPQFKKEKDYYEMAADVLRRERFPVNRCNNDGSYNLNGKYWRVGRTVLEPDQLVEKADKYR